IDPNDPIYQQMKDIFGRFAAEGLTGAEEDENPSKPEVFYDDDDGVQDEEQEEETVKKLSKKARKKMNHLSPAELKQIVESPEVVEWNDVDSQDPRLLVTIKSQHNIVPVPTHWSMKREYLSGKRGIEKKPYVLPRFIQDTGIAEMRDAVLEKQAEATLKQKQRERVQPKMGKLDIDYQKLYEAFFRFQSKPELTRFGEVYYEGKEFETNLRHLRPGEVSEDLKNALGMPPGAPPPWLLNMQRLGPPPGYPSLKIPGLNAPIPPGASWGYHAGGYGKPPVDEYQRPLFGGDVFGVNQPAQSTEHLGEAIERDLWGELQPQEDEEEEDEDEEEESEEEEEEADMETTERGATTAADMRAGLQTPSGLETPSGVASAMPSEFGGMESVQGDFTLRKQRPGAYADEQPARSAYQVLPEHRVQATGFFGSERGYDVRGAGRGGAPANVPMLGQQQAGAKRKAGDIDVSVDVDTLQRDDRLSRDEVRRQYEAQRQREGAGAAPGVSGSSGWGTIDQDDLSSMIAEESR
ncbi:hypothetical protein BDY21DRAFT_264217, partial [Lineolata rhizophorae]